MNKKPTYQELEQRIKELEEESVKRNQAEEALRESEERYRSLFKNNHSIMLLIDPENADIVDVNPAAISYYGWSHEELTGKKITDINILTKEKIFQEMERAKKEKRQHFFFRHRLSNGEIRDVEVYSGPITIYGRKLLYSIIHDITDRKLAEEALRDSEARLEALSEASFEAIFLSEKGVCLDQNKTAERIFGYTRAEAVGRHGTEWIAPEDREQVKNNMLSGYDKPYEVTALRKDGTTFPCEIQARMTDYQGRSIRITALRDITDRKRAEKELLFKENIIRSSSSVIATCDLEGNMTYGNPSFIKAWGFNDPKEFLGRPFRKFWLVEEQLEEIMQALRVEGTWVGEIQAIRKDGTLFDVQISAATVFDSGGNPIALTSTSIDITDRKQAEAALRESEEKFRDLVENINEVIYTVDKSGQITYISPAIESKSGYNRQELIGRSISKFVYHEDLPRLMEQFQNILSGHLEPNEYRLLAKSGEVIWVSVSSRPVYEGDQVVGLRGVMTDITESKRLQAQLLQSQKMEAIGTLAGGIAHQFNNALSGITGNIDLLEMDLPGDETVANYTRAMKDSARRMTELTTQLLAYARGGKFHAKTVLFSDFVRETLPLLKHTLGSAIDVDTDLLLGIMNVKADLTQMQMVLSAVLTNASEAMEGKGRIRVACRDTIITDENVGDFPGLTPGNYVNLTIVDDGKGMDKETRALIFEPFFTTKFTGRGLGMAAAYGVVKNHDGWISVESEPGKGTEVQIYLPAVEVPVKKHAKPESKAKWIKGTGTILVIEDEEPVMKISRAILERLGYRVLEARTGQEAIDVVKTFDGHIDLALLDILLPDMSGNDIYPLIMEARPDLKVIVFSGYSIDGPAREILNAGAENFIQKPLTIAALSEKLKKTLGGEQ